MEKQKKNSRRRHTIRLTIDLKTNRSRTVQKEDSETDSIERGIQNQSQKRGLNFQNVIHLTVSSKGIEFIR